MKVYIEISDIDDLEKLKYWIDKVIAPVENSSNHAISLDSDIHTLKLSSRAETSLRAYGIMTVGALIKLKPMDVLKSPNCGRKSLKEIEESLHLCGLSLSKV